jgi:hypothetical protein
LFTHASDVFDTFQTSLKYLKDKRNSKTFAVLNFGVFEKAKISIFQKTDFEKWLYMYIMQVLMYFIKYTVYRYAVFIPMPHASL